MDDFLKPQPVRVPFQFNLMTKDKVDFPLTKGSEHDRQHARLADTPAVLSLLLDLA